MIYLDLRNNFLHLTQKILLNLKIVIMCRFKSYNALIIFSLMFLDIIIIRTSRNYLF